MILLEFGNNDIALLNTNFLQPLEKWSEKYRGIRIELCEQDDLATDDNEVAYLQLYPSTSVYGDADDPIHSYSFRSDGTCIVDINHPIEETFPWYEAAQAALRAIVKESKGEIERVRKIAEGLKEIEKVVEAT